MLPASTPHETGSTPVSLEVIENDGQPWPQVSHLGQLLLRAQKESGGSQWLKQRQFAGNWRTISVAPFGQPPTKQSSQGEDACLLTLLSLLLWWLLSL